MFPQKQILGWSLGYKKFIRDQVLEEKGGGSRTGQKEKASGHAVLTNLRFRPASGELWSWSPASMAEMLWSGAGAGAGPVAVEAAAAHTPAGPFMDS